MPVTARLSSRFYEKMGDEATAELVNWLNDVDSEFRAQLRDSNDRNWDRFRADLNAAKAELRADLAALRGEIHSELAGLRGELHSGLAGLRGELHSGLAGQGAELHSGLAGQGADLRGEFQAGIAALQTEMHRELRTQLRWMFGFWATTLLAIAGLKLL